MTTLKEFFNVYKLYRRRNTRRYSVWIAYGIAFKKLPF